MKLALRTPEPLAARLAAVGADQEDIALAVLRQVADRLERDGASDARRSPAEAAALMRASRGGDILPDGVTIRDLLTHGRA